MALAKREWNFQAYAEEVKLGLEHEMWLINIIMRDGESGENTAANLKSLADWRTRNYWIDHMLKCVNS